MRKKKPEVTPPPTYPVQRVIPPLMSVRLPPFSGDRTVCIKCGNQGAHTYYKSSGETCVHSGGGPRVVWGAERLHRSCRRCDFGWDEACVPPIPQEIKETLVMPVVRGG